jgi:hypothetical protein
MLFLLLLLLLLLDLSPQSVMVTTITELCSANKTCTLDVFHPALNASVGDVLRVVSTCAW